MRYFGKPCNLSSPCGSGSRVRPGKPRGGRGQAGHSRPTPTAIDAQESARGARTAEAVVSGTSLKLYFAHAFNSLAFHDFVPPTLKTVVFGLIIGNTSAYLGYNATGGAEGVGRAATQSVVLSSALLILADVILVKFISFLFPGTNG